MRQIIIPATLSAVSQAAQLRLLQSGKDGDNFDEWLSAFDDQLLVVGDGPVTKETIDKAFTNTSKSQRDDSASVDEKNPMPAFVEEQKKKGIVPKTGRLTSIKCPDGSTKFCNEGSVGCYDESVALCGKLGSVKRSKLGQNCQGFDLLTGKPFPDCEEGLACLESSSIFKMQGEEYTCQKVEEIGKERQIKCLDGSRKTCKIGQPDCYDYSRSVCSSGLRFASQKESFLSKPTLKPIVYGQLEDKCDSTDPETGELYPRCQIGLKCLERFADDTFDLLEKVCLDPREYKAPRRPAPQPAPVVDPVEVLISEQCFDGTVFECYESDPECYYDSPYFCSKEQAVSEPEQIPLSEPIVLTNQPQPQGSLLLLDQPQQPTADDSNPQETEQESVQVEEKPETSEPQTQEQEPKPEVQAEASTEEAAPTTKPEKIDSKPAVVIEKEVIQPEVIEQEVLGPQEGDPIDIECEDGTILTCPLGSPGCEDYSENLCKAIDRIKVIHAMPMDLI